MRGFAALIVVIGHSMQFSDVLNPGYDFKRDAYNYLPPTHLAVMVFFMLSGCVIGMSYSNEKKFLVGEYLKKRLVRIYPIYLIAIAITVLFFKQEPKVVIGHLFFMQNAFVKNFTENVALWSLNYEMFYYLLAIPIIKYKLNVRYLAAFLSVLLALSFYKIHLPPQTEQYISGFLFWLAGYDISRNIKDKIEPAGHQLLAVLLLSLSVDYLNLFNVIVAKLNVSPSTADTDLAIFPYCLLIVLTFYGAKRTRLFYLLLGVVAISSFGQLFYAAFRGALTSSEIYILPALFLCIAALCWFIKPKITLRPLESVGSISYAIYAIHCPILYLIGGFVFLPGNYIGFVIRLILLLVITFTLSWVLEKKLQPVIKKYFDKKYPAYSLNS
ncbi:MAG: acyltransferase [Chitinophagaceae bacterium]